jgi:hypothetical protein
MPDHDECEHDAEFTDLVDELVTAYLLRTGCIMGALVTVHAELTDDVFTLQVGTGRDAAAFMQAAQLARDAARGL